MGCSSNWVLWLVAAVVTCAAFGLRGASAASIDLPNAVEHNYMFLFAPYSGRHQPGRNPEGSNTARYVQLSNGSRYVCETLSIQRRDPFEAKPGQLGSQMEAFIAAMRRTDSSCIHHAQEKQLNGYCWGTMVSQFFYSEGKNHVLGRSRTDGLQQYWYATDAFGRYAATIYGDGDECPYDKSRRIETEVRFYCLSSHIEKLVPYMSLYESSQCRYVMSLPMKKLCSIPQLDHSRVKETVQCHMLDD
ncbi:hypothetical protein JKF63_00799 [Porcisia hertigi]|uniref:MRH domain-containing protein n=1 Tax=Porcisia hertigi TaxID=2761500 RepID=A0A836GYY7_9TRYP|nr:hypothetical protein JKF63_00799 [Porcisia hertigi]